MPPAELMAAASVPVVVAGAPPVKPEQVCPKLKVLGELSLKEILGLDYRQLAAYDEQGLLKPSFANGRLFVDNMQAMKRLYAQNMAMRHQRIEAQFQLRKNRPGFSKAGIRECERRIAAIADKEAAILGGYERRRQEITQALSMTVMGSAKRPYNAAEAVFVKGYRAGVTLGGKTVLTRNMTRNQKRTACRFAGDMSVGLGHHYPAGRIVVHDLDSNEVTAVQLQGEDRFPRNEPRDAPEFVQEEHAWWKSIFDLSKRARARLQSQEPMTHYKWVLLDEAKGRYYRGCQQPKRQQLAFKDDWLEQAFEEAQVCCEQQMIVKAVRKVERAEQQEKRAADWRARRDAAIERRKKSWEARAAAWQVARDAREQKFKAEFLRRKAAWEKEHHQYLLRKEKREMEKVSPSTFVTKAGREVFRRQNKCEALGGSKHKHECIKCGGIYTHSHHWVSEWHHQQKFDCPHCFPEWHDAAKEAKKRGFKSPVYVRPTTLGQWMGVDKPAFSVVPFNGAYAVASGGNIVAAPVHVGRIAQPEHSHDLQADVSFTSHIVRVKALDRVEVYSPKGLEGSFEVQADKIYSGRWKSLTIESDKNLVSGSIIMKGKRIVSLITASHGNKYAVQWRRSNNGPLIYERLTYHMPSHAGVSWSIAGDHVVLEDGHMRPYHITREADPTDHQFPDLIVVRRPIPDVRSLVENDELLTFDRGGQAFKVRITTVAWCHHVHDGRLIGAVLPAFECAIGLPSGMPIFKNDQLLSVVTKSEAGIYPVSGAAVDSVSFSDIRQVSLDVAQAGQACYGNRIGNYDEIKAHAIEMSSKDPQPNYKCNVVSMPDRLHVTVVDVDGRENVCIRFPRSFAARRLHSSCIHCCDKKTLESISSAAMLNSYSPAIGACLNDVAAKFVGWGYPGIELVTSEDFMRSIITNVVGRTSRWVLPAFKRIWAELESGVSGHISNRTVTGAVLTRYFHYIVALFPAVEWDCGVGDPELRFTNQDEPLDTRMLDWIVTIRSQWREQCARWANPCWRPYSKEKPSQIVDGDHQSSTVPMFVAAHHSCTDNRVQEAVAADVIAPMRLKYLSAETLYAQKIIDGEYREVELSGSNKKLLVLHCDATHTYIAEASCRKSTEDLTSGTVLYQRWGGMNCLVSVVTCAVLEDGQWHYAVSTYENTSKVENSLKENWFLPNPNQKMPRGGPRVFDDCEFMEDHMFSGIKSGALGLFNADCYRNNITYLRSGNQTTVAALDLVRVNSLSYPWRIRRCFPVHRVSPRVVTSVTYKNDPPPPETNPSASEGAVKSKVTKKTNPSRPMKMGEVLNLVKTRKRVETCRQVAKLANAEANNLSRAMISQQEVRSRVAAADSAKRQLLKISRESMSWWMLLMVLLAALHTVSSNEKMNAVVSRASRTMRDLRDYLDGNGTVLLGLQKDWAQIDEDINTEYKVRHNKVSKMRINDTFDALVKDYQLLLKQFHSKNDQWVELNALVGDLNDSIERWYRELSSAENYARGKRESRSGVGFMLGTVREALEFFDDFADPEEVSEANAAASPRPSVSVDRRKRGLFGDEGVQWYLRNPDGTQCDTTCTSPVTGFSSNCSKTSQRHLGLDCHGRPQVAHTGQYEKPDGVLVIHYKCNGTQRSTVGCLTIKTRLRLLKLQPPCVDCILPIVYSFGVEGSRGIAVELESVKVFAKEICLGNTCWQVLTRLDSACCGLFDLRNYSAKVTSNVCQCDSVNWKPDVEYDVRVKYAILAVFSVLVVALLPKYIAIAVLILVWANAVMAGGVEGATEVSVPGQREYAEISSIALVVSLLLVIMLPRYYVIIVIFMVWSGTAKAECTGGLTHQMGQTDIVSGQKKYTVTASIAPGDCLVSGTTSIRINSLTIMYEYISVGEYPDGFEPVVLKADFCCPGGSVSRDTCRETKVKEDKEKCARDPKNIWKDRAEVHNIMHSGCAGWEGELSVGWICLKPTTPFVRVYRLVNRWHGASMNVTIATLDTVKNVQVRNDVVYTDGLWFTSLVAADYEVPEYAALVDGTIRVAPESFGINEFCRTLDGTKLIDENCVAIKFDHDETGYDVSHRHNNWHDMSKLFYVTDSVALLASDDAKLQVAVTVNRAVVEATFKSPVDTVTTQCDTANSLHAVRTSNLDDLARYVLVGHTSSKCLLTLSAYPCQILGRDVVVVESTFKLNVAIVCGLRTTSVLVVKTTSKEFAVDIDAPLRNSTHLWGVVYRHYNLRMTQLMNVTDRWNLGAFDISGIFSGWMWNVKKLIVTGSLMALGAIAILNYNIPVGAICVGGAMATWVLASPLVVDEEDMSWLISLALLVVWRTWMTLIRTINWAVLHPEWTAGYRLVRLVALAYSGATVHHYLVYWSLVFVKVMKFIIILAKNHGVVIRTEQRQQNFALELIKDMFPTKVRGYSPRGEGMPLSRFDNPLTGMGRGDFVFTGCGSVKLSTLLGLARTSGNVYRVEGCWAYAGKIRGVPFVITTCHTTEVDVDEEVKTYGDVLTCGLSEAPITAMVGDGNYSIAMHDVASGEGGTIVLKVSGGLLKAAILTLKSSSHEWYSWEGLSGLVINRSGAYQVQCMAAKSDPRISVDGGAPGRVYRMAKTTVSECKRNPMNIVSNDVIILSRAVPGSELATVGLIDKGAFYYSASPGARIVGVNRNRTHGKIGTVDVTANWDGGRIVCTPTLTGDFKSSADKPLLCCRFVEGIATLSDSVFTVRPYTRMIDVRYDITNVVYLKQSITDALNAQELVLVHGINARCTHGAGAALALKNKVPEMMPTEAQGPGSYVVTLSRAEHGNGDWRFIHVVVKTDPLQPAINVYTDEGAMSQLRGTIIDHTRLMSNKLIALTPFACGLGGIDPSYFEAWVRKLAAEVSEDTVIHVYAGTDEAELEANYPRFCFEREGGYCWTYERVPGLLTEWDNMAQILEAARYNQVVLSDMGRNNPAMIEMCDNPELVIDPGNIVGFESGAYATVALINGAADKHIAFSSLADIPLFEHLIIIYIKTPVASGCIGWRQQFDEWAHGGATSQWTVRSDGERMEASIVYDADSENNIIARPGVVQIYEIQNYSSKGMGFGSDGGIATSFHVTKGNKVIYTKVDQVSQQLTSYQYKCTKFDNRVDYAFYEQGVVLQTARSGDLYCVIDPEDSKVLWLLCTSSATNIRQLDNRVFATFIPVSVNFVDKTVCQRTDWQLHKGMSGLPIFKSDGGFVGIYGCSVHLQHAGTFMYHVISQPVLQSERSATVIATAVENLLASDPHPRAKARYLVLPTGYGKTVKFPTLLARKHDGPVIINLLEPTRDAAINAFEGIRNVLETNRWTDIAVELRLGRVNNQETYSRWPTGNSNITKVIKVATSGRAWWAFQQYDCTAKYHILDECHMRDNVDVVGMHINLLTSRLDSRHVIFMTATPAEEVQEADLLLPVPPAVPAFNIVEENLLTRPDGACWELDLPSMSPASVRGIWGQKYYLPKRVTESGRTIIFVAWRSQVIKLCQALERQNTEGPGLRIVPYWSGHQVTDIQSLPPRCILVSTDVIGMAVTISDCVAVVDLGIENKPNRSLVDYSGEGNPSQDNFQFTTSFECRVITDAVAKQRKGRTGRVCDGVYYQLPGINHERQELWPAETCVQLAINMNLKRQIEDPDWAALPDNLHSIRWVWSTFQVPTDQKEVLRQMNMFQDVFFFRRTISTEWYEGALQAFTNDDYKHLRLARNEAEHKTLLEKIKLAWRNHFVATEQNRREKEVAEHRVIHCEMADLQIGQSAASAADNLAAQYGIGISAVNRTLRAPQPASPQEESAIMLVSVFVYGAIGLLGCTEINDRFGARYITKVSEATPSQVRMIAMGCQEKESTGTSLSILSIIDKLARKIWKAIQNGWETFSKFWKQEGSPQVGQESVVTFMAVRNYIYAAILPVVASMSAQQVTWTAANTAAGLLYRKISGFLGQPVAWVLTTVVGAVTSSLVGLGPMFVSSAMSLMLHYVNDWAWGWEELASKSSRIKTYGQQHLSAIACGAVASLFAPNILDFVVKNGIGGEAVALAIAPRPTTNMLLQSDPRAVGIVLSYSVYRIVTSAFDSQDGLSWDQIGNVATVAWTLPNITIMSGLVGVGVGMMVAFLQRVMRRSQEAKLAGAADRRQGAYFSRVERTVDAEHINTEEMIAFVYSIVATIAEPTSTISVIVNTILNAVDNNGKWGEAAKKALREYAGCHALMGAACLFIRLGHRMSSRAGESEGIISKVVSSISGLFSERPSEVAVRAMEPRHRQAAARLAVTHEATLMAGSRDLYQSLVTQQWRKASEVWGSLAEATKLTLVDTLCTVMRPVMTEASYAVASESAPEAIVELTRAFALTSNSTKSFFCFNGCQSLVRTIWAGLKHVAYIIYEFVKDKAIWVWDKLCAIVKSLGVNFCEGVTERLGVLGRAVAPHANNQQTPDRNSGAEYNIVAVPCRQGLISMISRTLTSNSALQDVVRLLVPEMVEMQTCCGPWTTEDGYFDIGRGQWAAYAVSSKISLWQLCYDLTKVERVFSATSRCRRRDHWLDCDVAYNGNATISLSISWRNTDRSHQATIRIVLTVGGVKHLAATAYLESASQEVSEIDCEGVRGVIVGSGSAPDDILNVFLAIAQRFTSPCALEYTALSELPHYINGVALCGDIVSHIASLTTTRLGAILNTGAGLFGSFVLARNNAMTDSLSRLEYRTPETRSGLKEVLDYGVSHSQADCYILSTRWLRFLPSLLLGSPQIDTILRGSAHADDGKVGQYIEGEMLHFFPEATSMVAHAKVVPLDQQVQIYHILKENRVRPGPQLPSLVANAFDGFPSADLENRETIETRLVYSYGVNIYCYSMCSSIGCCGCLVVMQGSGKLLHACRVHVWAFGEAERNTALEGIAGANIMQDEQPNRQAYADWLHAGLLVQLDRDGNGVLRVSEPTGIHNQLTSERPVVVGLESDNIISRVQRTLTLFNDDVEPDPGAYANILENDRLFSPHGLVARDAPIVPRAVAENTYLQTKPVVGTNVVEDLVNWFSRDLIVMLIILTESTARRICIKVKKWVRKLCDALLRISLYERSIKPGLDPFAIAAESVDMPIEEAPLPEESYPAIERPTVKDRWLTWKEKAKWMLIDNLSWGRLKEKAKASIFSNMVKQENITSAQYEQLCWRMARQLRPNQRDRFMMECRLGERSIARVIYMYGTFSTGNSFPSYENFGGVLENYFKWLKPWDNMDFFTARDLVNFNNSTPLPWTLNRVVKWAAGLPDWFTSQDEDTLLAAMINDREKFIAQEEQLSDDDFVDKYLGTSRAPWMANFTHYTTGRPGGWHWWSSAIGDRSPRFVAGGATDHLSMLSAVSRRNEHHAARLGKSYDKFKYCNRLLPPGISLKTMDSLGDVYASKGAIKAQQLFEMDPHFFSSCQTIWEPASGSGGFGEYLSYAYRNVKGSTYCYSTWLRAQHRQPQPDFMQYKGSKMKHVNILTGSRSDGDMRDPELRKKYRQVGSQDPPDLVIFDCGETDPDIYREGIFYHRDRYFDGRRVSNLEAMDDLLSNLKVGGKMICKFVGVSKYVSDAVAHLTRRFKRLKVTRLPTCPDTSREFYIYCSGYDPDRCNPRGSYCSLMDNILQEMCSIAHRWDMDAHHRRLSELNLGLRNDWYRPDARVQVGRTYSTIDNEDEVPGISVDVTYPIGGGRTQTLKWEWTPRIRERLRLIVAKGRKDFKRNLIVKRYEGFKWQHLKGLGVLSPHTSRDEKPRHVVNRLIGDAVFSIWGTKLANGAYGCTQASRARMEDSYRTRLDKYPGVMKDKYFTLFLGVLWNGLTARGKEIMNGPDSDKLTLLTKQEVEVMMNYKGSCGLLSRYGNLRQYIEATPDWYERGMRKVNKWKAGEATDSYATVRAKKESKERKDTQDGKLMYEKGTISESELLANGDMTARCITFFDEDTRIAHMILLGRLILEHHKNKLYRHTISGTPPHKVGGVVRAMWDAQALDKDRILSEGSNRAARITISTNGSYNRQEMAALAIDFSRLDASVTEQERMAAANLNSQLFRRELRSAIMSCSEEMTYALCFDDLGNVFAKAGQRGSGEILTSYENTQLVGAHMDTSICLSLGLSIEEISQVQGVIEFTPDLSQPGETEDTKVFELTKINFVADGDDLVVVTSMKIAKILLSSLDGFLAQGCKSIRSGTSSGAEMCRKFGQLHFCSHSYEPTVVSSKIAEMRAVNISPEALCRQSGWVRFADQVGGVLLWTPHRVAGLIIGKLSPTLKAVTQLNRIDALEEAKNLTRSKCLSYLLLYPTMFTVQVTCLSVLAYVGDGDVSIGDEFSHAGAIMNLVRGETIKGALLSLYGVSDFDSFIQFDYATEQAELKAVRHNAGLIGIRLDIRRADVLLRCSAWLAKLGISSSEYLELCRIGEKIKLLQAQPDKIEQIEMGFDEVKPY